MKKLSNNEEFNYLDNNYHFNHRTFWEYKKEQCRFDIYITSDFSKLKNIKQVYAIIFNTKNQILIVGDKDSWTLPGWGVEKGETLLETLHREIYEEAAVKVNNKEIKPFFFQKGYKKVNKEWIYKDNGVRFVCKLDQQDKFIADPGGNTCRQKFVDIRELDKYLEWGQTTKLIQEEALKIFLS